MRLGWWADFNLERVAQPTQRASQDPLRRGQQFLSVAAQGAQAGRFDVGCSGGRGGGTYDWCTPGCQSLPLLLGSLLGTANIMRLVEAAHLASS